MPHQNTVFRQLTNQLPWGVLDRTIAQSGADKRVRKLFTREMLLALLFAQAGDVQSLRDIEAELQEHAARRYHSGLPQTHRSTLADALASRPVEVFATVLSSLVGRLTGKMRRSLADCVRLIDSTSVKLSSLSADWARFSAGVYGAKAHIIDDPDADCPLYLDVTPARVNDITAAHTMPIEPGATYVFDLGYYDFAWWARLHEADCRIVTRLKSNTPLRPIETLPLPDDTAHILSDRIGFLPQRMARSRHNPMADAVREIMVRTDSGKLLRIVSNDLDAPATEIAALYRRRWAIELFFRWVKQHLRIRHFYGTSETAVRIQIAVALIAFVLMKLAHLAQGAVASLTRFVRLVGGAVLHRKRLDQFGRGSAPPDPNTTKPSAQGTLLWT